MISVSHFKDAHGVLPQLNDWLQGLDLSKKRLAPILMSNGSTGIVQYGLQLDEMGLWAGLILAGHGTEMMLTLEIGIKHHVFELDLVTGKPQTYDSIGLVSPKDLDALLISDLNIGLYGAPTVPFKSVYQCGRACLTAHPQLFVNGRLMIIDPTNASTEVDEMSRRRKLMVSTADVVPDLEKIAS